ncbi:uncharacterized protein LOC110641388 [Hevea brasiliensis]|uniref:uncharacterized protein LOC110641388 n=1 Tax=Hevea brasiliensis TaxID=3981 RepID=UPI000B78CB8A|nr:uncharacterized protein LOC110641388 [Hevea brasiliensis]
MGLLLELWAVYHGIKLLEELGISHAIVECDNKGVDIISGSMMPMASCLSLARSVHDLMVMLRDISVVHVYRESNFSADWLVGIAKSVPLGKHVLLNPPTGVLPWLAHERVGITYCR